jgi:hypothetical protein
VVIWGLKNLWLREVVVEKKKSLESISCFLRIPSSSSSSSSSCGLVLELECCCCLKNGTQMGFVGSPLQLEHSFLQGAMLKCSSFT